MDADWSVDHYEVLGVPVDATPAQVKAAYRRRAKQLHPDVPGSGDDVEFARVARAYEVLADAESRRVFDASRRAGAAGIPLSGAAAVDVADYITGLFYRAAGAAPRGPDLEAEVRVGFAQACTGGVVHVRLGQEDTARTVSVQLPAGLRDGARLRLAGRGGALAGHEPGDLYVLVQVSPHPVFSRDGDDLRVSLPVTFPEVALGATVPVPLLDGSTVLLRIPPGTPSGRTFRISGHGVTRPGGDTTGDLLVTVLVEVPDWLDEDARELLEAYAARTGHDPRAEQLKDVRAAAEGPEARENQ